jgi:hypothetical protein
MRRRKEVSRPGGTQRQQLRAAQKIGRESSLAVKLTATGSMKEEREGNFAGSKALGGLGQRLIKTVQKDRKEEGIVMILVDG